MKTEAEIREKILTIENRRTKSPLYSYDAVIALLEWVLGPSGGRRSED